MNRGGIFQALWGTCPQVGSATDLWFLKQQLNVSLGLKGEEGRKIIYPLSSVVTCVGVMDTRCDSTALTSPLPPPKRMLLANYGDC